MTQSNFVVPESSSRCVVVGRGWCFYVIDTTGEIYTCIILLTISCIEHVLTERTNKLQTGYFESNIHEDESGYPQSRVGNREI